MLTLEYSVFEKGKRAPEYTLDSDLNGQVSLKDMLQFLKSSLIVIADEVLREEQNKGFDKDPIVRVDGKKNKRVIDVSPIGSIEFISNRAVTEILPEIYDALFKRSPVDTGQYISSHYFFWNGKQVATNPTQLAAWIATNPPIKDKDILRFVNITPYGRRLERLGVTSKRQQSRRTQSRDKKQRSGAKILAPNGTYFLTAKSLTRKFRNSLKFSFIPGSLLGLTAKFKTPSKASSKSRKNKKTSTYLYPSISIIAGEAGKAR